MFLGKIVWQKLARISVYHLFCYFNYQRWDVFRIPFSSIAIFEGPKYCRFYVIGTNRIFEFFFQISDVKAA